jgi:hypothetical protein
MGPLSSVRTLMPAAHNVPVAALNAAATSNASFLVVCPARNMTNAVLAALQVATKGTNLVLSSRVVAAWRMAAPASIPRRLTMSSSS